MSHVEWRWIDGGILGYPTDRTESEFVPGPELTMVAALAAHRERAVPTDAVARSAPTLTMPCSMQAGTDLR